MPAKKKNQKKAGKSSRLKDLKAKSDPKAGLMSSYYRIGGPRSIT